MRPDTIDALLEEQAQRRPDAPAFLAPGGARVSFGQARARTAAAADRLAALGVRRADRVAIALPQTPDAALAILATTSVAVAAPLPAELPRSEATARLHGLRARALVVAADDEGGLVQAARDAGIAVVRLVADAAGSFDLAGEAFGEPATRHAPSTDDVAVILHTSGTTAQPKRVPHTHAALVHGARVGSASLALGPDDRSLWFAPLHHIGGLLGALVYPLACGAATGLAPRFDPDRFFDWLLELAPTWYWGVPAMHQALLERAAAHDAAVRRARLRVVRSGAAPLAPALIERLEATFRAPLLEVYGMTEAGLITSNPLPPRAQKPGSVGVAVGCEVAVLDEAGRPLPAGAEGELVARGPGVMREYDGDPEATRDAFRDGWLRTGDLGRLDADGYLTITGRLKEQINRGGVKISPRAVDDALLAHPAVLAAAAFALPHPRLGEDLAAAVVLRAGRHAAPGELRAFLRRRLELARVPGRIVVVDAIPLGPTGKPLRRELAALLPAPAASAAPEPDTVEAEMCRLWADVLERDAVGPDDDFFDLGGDSVGAARLMAEITKRLGPVLPAAALLEAPTPGSLLLLARLRGGAAPPALVPLSGSPHGAPFVFCVGMAPLLQLQRLARRLGPAHRVYALFTGSMRDAMAAERVEAFAEHGLRELRDAAPGNAVALAGFCFGAVVAYEMARRLEGAGGRPRILALFDPPTLPPRFRHRVVDRARARLAGLRGRHVTPGEPLRRALARYRPGTYSGRALLFLTPECPPDGDEATAAAWRRLLPDAPEVHHLRAGHAQLFDAANVSLLADRLARP
jgi:acyl-CoA synthetase (AMP-forming)/AMP-acid ligase II/thioesterase domain-containing protein/acyl carrier protein